MLIAVYQEAVKCRKHIVKHAIYLFISKFRHFIVVLLNFRKNEKGERNKFSLLTSDNISYFYMRRKKYCEMCKYAWKGGEKHLSHLTSQQALLLSLLKQFFQDVEFITWIMQSKTAVKILRLMPKRRISYRVERREANLRIF